MTIEQAIDNLEAAVNNWVETRDKYGTVTCGDAEAGNLYLRMTMQAEDVVVARFVDLLELVTGPRNDLRDLVRRYEANTSALTALLDDSGPQVMFLQMDD